MNLSGANHGTNQETAVGILFFDSSGAGSPPGFYRWFLKAADKAGVQAYLFRPNDVPDIPGRISGYSLTRFTGGGRWIRSLHRWPDVVFDHIRSRAAERSPEVQAAKRRLTAGGARFYGPGFLDKWQVYRSLVSYRDLAAFLPETETLTGPGQVLEMLRRHRSVFLKPMSGTLGLGVIRIARDDGKGFVFNRTVNLRRSAAGRIPPGDFGRTVTRWTSVRPYLVQQGLNLATIEGRPLDFRFLVQKDQNSRWVMVYAFGKLAAQGKVVTNIANGGDFLALDRALVPVVGRSWRMVAAKMEETALRLAAAIDREIGPLGELGLDLAIDQRNRLWLLEANSKFSRWVLPPVIREKSLVMVFTQARHLAARERGTPIEGGRG